MSLLIKFAKLRQPYIKNFPIVLTVTFHHWNKNYRPVPYPRLGRTLDNGENPRQTFRGVNIKDPLYRYDKPKNIPVFKEPIHEKHGLREKEKYDVGACLLRYPHWFKWWQFLGAMIVFFGVYCLFDKVKSFHPVSPGQFPRDERNYKLETKS